MEAAACAVHLGEPSTGTCRRCGAFTCAQCTVRTTTGLCGACVDRVVAPELPFRGDDFKVLEVFGHCLKVFGAHWGRLSVASTIVWAVAIFIQYAFPLVSRFWPFAVEMTPRFELVASIVSFVLVSAFWGAAAATMSQLALGIFNGQPDEVSLRSQVRSIRALLRAGACGVLMWLPPLLPMLILSVILALYRSTATRDVRNFVLAVAVLLGALVYGLTLPFWYLLPSALARGDRTITTGILEICRAIVRRPAAVIGATALITVLFGVGLAALCVGVIPALAIAMVFATAIQTLLRDSLTEPTG